MKKILVLMVFIVSLSLLVAGCSDATKTDDSNAAGGTYPAGSEDAGKSDTPQDIPDATMNSGDVVVAESKTQVEKNDDTLDSLVADGTYAEDVTYMSPAGLETLEISISVQDDVVTAVSLTPIVAAPKSTEFINKVNAALPDLVVGKKITELDIPKQISGSSLTTAAFKKQVEAVIAENPA